ncbi:MAG: amino acid ABC transporter permease [Lachnospiraceae bacterium]|nr:amino acid ABC transporter permease [Lachnospiraceae bacterium]
MYRLNFRFLSNPQYIALLKEGAVNTVIITFFCLIFGFLIGLVIALLRQSKNKVLRFLGAFWVDFLRNTPFLVQLFFFYYGLPQLGIDTDPLITSIIALSINVSAGNCEVIRAGLMAVKKSYYECAAALGFGPLQTIRYVVLPISLRVSFKPLVNNFVNLVLTTSVCFSITVVDMMGASKIINGRVDRPFEIYLLLLAAYCILTFLVSMISKVVDKKIAITL